jgi:hypothetical protein
MQNVPRFRSVDGYKRYGGKYCLHHQMIFRISTKGMELIGYPSDCRLHK